jgi:lipopolysaccharide transport system ATP-binding protein
VNAVECHAVAKSYSIYDSPGDRLKELIAFQRLSFHRDYWALRDLTFDIQRGETFCIIGENGSGKSTLLQIIAGILQPTSGSLHVGGRVAALLELGSGFNPEFTGRDNVYLNGAILGFSRREIDRKYRDIEEFAEIGDFIDQPVKTYSSGMAVRLGFAVAIHVDPEVLLVDEALAVGDIYFRQRCLRKIHELRARGVTILFVSHSMADVKAIGDRTLWLDRGRVREIGETGKVASKYLAAMSEKDSVYLTARRGTEAVAGSPTGPRHLTSIPNIDHRRGEGGAEITGIAVLDEYGEPLHLMEPGSRATVRITARAQRALAEPVIGFVMRNHLGIDFAGDDTFREETPLPAMQTAQMLTVDFHLELPELYPAFFSFSPFVCDGAPPAGRVCDWIDNAVALQMAHGAGQVYGYVHLPCRVELNTQTESTLG